MLSFGKLKVTGRILTEKKAMHEQAAVQMRLGTQDASLAIVSQLETLADDLKVLLKT